MNATIKKTCELITTYTDRPGDVVIHEGVSRRVRCWSRHARKRGFAILHFMDSRRAFVVPLDQEWQVSMLDEHALDNIGKCLCGTFGCTKANGVRVEAVAW